MKRFISLFLSLALCGPAIHVVAKSLRIASPDGRIGVSVTIGQQLAYSVVMDGDTVLSPSAMAMAITDGTVWGKDCRLRKSQVTKVCQPVASPFTRQAEMTDNYTQLSLRFGQYDVIVRAYNDGVAYRFVGNRKGNYQVGRETVEYVFAADQVVIHPYVTSYHQPGKKTLSFQEQFCNMHESYYSVNRLSGLDRTKLSFLPLVVEVGKGRKMCITETHLESYPGLYLVGADGNRLIGVNAPRPKTWHQGGHNQLELMVDEVEPFIATIDGPRPFPWRIAMLSRTDADLAVNNLSWLLAAPSRVADISWIKPGKVAWDWWNDWNLSKVDFKAGINNRTYEYYIDFASRNKIEYVILDEGWAVNGKADLFQVVPDIDLQHLVDYAAKRNVGIILWAGYYAFDRDMERICKHYSEMGIKGFKVDFMDRDDQIMADFYYRAAATTARYHMIIDYHGGFKPAGLNRTYPNALNFEGVAGLEQLKMARNTIKTCDQVKYDCQLPFLRQAAGPMDYTQGAMRNACIDSFYPVWHEPMSQGTRCHQLGLYAIFESPFSMLCDTPCNYEAEPECTGVIAAIPTVWDETRVLCGKMGEYIVTARRSGRDWYIGGITNWNRRILEFDIADDMNGQATLYCDGLNSLHNAADYQVKKVKATGHMKIYCERGGGFLMHVSVQ